VRPLVCASNYEIAITQIADVITVREAVTDGGPGLEERVIAIA
jgi:hypothetical protein